MYVVNVAAEFVRFVKGKVDSVEVPSQELAVSFVKIPDPEKKMGYSCYMDTKSQEVFYKLRKGQIKRWEMNGVSRKVRLLHNSQGQPVFVLATTFDENKNVIRPSDACIRISQELKGDSILKEEIALGAKGRIKMVSRFMYSDLHDAILKDSNLQQNFQLKTSILIQVIGALDELHAHPAAHGDLKLENILYHKEKAVLADFEFSKMAFSEGERYIKGTAGYAAPEIRKGEVTSLEAMQKSDIWSFAMTAFVFWFLDKPENAMVKLRKEQAEGLSINQYMARFLLSILKEDPKERMAAREILQQLKTFQNEFFVTEDDEADLLAGDVPFF